MLLDWITIAVPLDCMTIDGRFAVATLGDRVRRYCPQSGIVRWEQSAWDSVRSDSHQVAFRPGSDCLYIQGSPARVVGAGDSVFSRGPVARLNLQASVWWMVTKAFRMLGVGSWRGLPWRQCRGQIRVSRIDVTGNLVLPSVADVRVALRELRETEGGRYRVSQTAGDTVYWSHKSRLRAGKAYAKGPHLRYLIRKAKLGFAITSGDLEAADRLLRLELSLKSQWLRERAGCEWWELDAERLIAEWRAFFERMVGSVEMTYQGETVADRVRAVCDSPRQSGVVLGTWGRLQSEGWQSVRESMPRATWYRHLAVLRRAGLGDADLSTGRVVSLRRRSLVLAPVGSWEELRRCA